MPWGWIMEELNEKIIFPNKYLGSEFGIARYQRISNYDFSPAYDYWNDTKEYWSIVRETWSEILSRKTVCLLGEVEGKPLYQYKFILQKIIKIIQITKKHMKMFMKQ